MVNKYIEYKSSGFTTDIRREYLDLHRQFRLQKRLNIRLKKAGHLRKINQLFKLDKNEFWKSIKKMQKSSSQVDIETSYLKEHMEEIFTKHNQVSVLSPREFEKAEDSVKFFKKDFENKKFEVDLSIEELSKMIKNLPNNKTVGLSFLSNEMLKYCDCNEVTLILKLIFEKMINHQINPTLFNLSIIKPLIKCEKKPNTDIDNIRPVAVSEPLANLFETVLLNRLNESFQESNKQFGFRSNYSCSHAVFCLKQALKVARNLKKRLYICAIDASKAFDKVVRAKLWLELIKKDIPPPIILAFIHYYDTSLMIVSNNGKYSKIFRTLVGVRQGGVASPKLFSIYINELIERLTECKEGLVISKIKLDTIVYADDI
ncbi:unnamed protein product, partial [Brachionus calyciflorus]